RLACAGSATLWRRVVAAADQRSTIGRIKIERRFGIQRLREVECDLDLAGLRGLEVIEILFVVGTHARRIDFSRYQRPECGGEPVVRLVLVAQLRPRSATLLLDCGW